MKEDLPEGVATDAECEFSYRTIEHIMRDAVPPFGDTLPALRRFVARLIARIRHDGERIADVEMGRDSWKEACRVRDVIAKDKDERISELRQGIMDALVEIDPGDEDDLPLALQVRMRATSERIAELEARNEKVEREASDYLDRLQKATAERDEAREKLATAVGGSPWFATMREEAKAEVAGEVSKLRAALERVERNMRSGQWEKVADVRQQVREALGEAREAGNA